MYQSDEAEVKTLTHQLRIGLAHGPIAANHKMVGCKERSDIYLITRYLFVELGGSCRLCVDGRGAAG